LFTAGNAKSSTPIHNQKIFAPSVLSNFIRELTIQEKEKLRKSSEHLEPQDLLISDPGICKAQHQVGL
jgi:hypothetical protein